MTKSKVLRGTWAQDDEFLIFIVNLNAVTLPAQVVQIGIIAKKFKQRKLPFSSHITVGVASWILRSLTYSSASSLKLAHLWEHGLGYFSFSHLKTLLTNDRIAFSSSPNCGQNLRKREFKQRGTAALGRGPRGWVVTLWSGVGGGGEGGWVLNLRQKKSYYRTWSN